MDEPASALHSAFVGGFRPYLNAILAERHLPDIPVETIDQAEAWLDETLHDLLEMPFAEQPHSPLEIVQRATTGITSALTSSGAGKVLRDPVTVAALPGDLYGIAPSSSSALGEEAFQAHIAWGIEKAKALAPLVSGAGRGVGLVSGDLMDISRFEDAVNGAGMRLQVWGKTGAGETRPVVAFVDLAHPAADEAIGVFIAERVRVIAYGPHVDEEAMARATFLGASEVLPRSRLFKSVAEYLPQIA
jgi:hypothetical protein